MKKRTLLFLLIFGILGTLGFFGKKVFLENISSKPNSQVLAQSEASDWPMFSYNLERTSNSPSQVNPPYTMKWRRDFYTGTYEINCYYEGWSYPNPCLCYRCQFITDPSETIQDEVISTGYQAIIYGNLAYVGTYQGNMYALDKKTGGKIWEFNAKGPIMHSPAVDNGVLFFGSIDGNLYALNALDGAEIWRFSSERGGFWNSPAVYNNVVYIGSRDSNFYAINANNGQEIWKYETDGPILNSPAIDTTKQRIYFASEDMYAYALNFDGSLAWKSIKKMAGQSLRYYHPVVAGDVIIFRTNPEEAMHETLASGDMLLGRTYGQYPVSTTRLQQGTPWKDTCVGETEGSSDCPCLYDKFFCIDPAATGTMQDIANEQQAVIQHLDTHPHEKTIYVFNSDSGEEPYTAGVLWTAGCHAPGYPPVITSDGKVLFEYRSYYSTYDMHGNITYHFMGIGELDLNTGTVNPLPLSNPGSNLIYSNGINFISDETTALSISGGRIYLAHNDMATSIDLNSMQVTSDYFGRRDIPGHINTRSTRFDGTQTAGGVLMRFVPNVWHGPGGSAISFSDNMFYYITASIVVGMEGQ